MDRRGEGEPVLPALQPAALRDPPGCPGKRLSADPLLLARAGFTGAHGIALSEFLSWPQHDQDLALAHQGYESHRCRSCGHHPDNGREVHAHVDVCPGCVAMKAAEKNAKDVPGAHVRLAVGPRHTCERCIAEHEANQH